MSDLVIIFERVMTVSGDTKGHFFSVEFDLEMFLLRLFRCSTETLKHTHDVSPMNVVRSWVRKNLLESELSVWHSFGFYTPTRKLFC